jgi:N-acetylglucosaminyl-diphospho-decaprenol L-rhamnosyltransferase
MRGHSRARIAVIAVTWNSSAVISGLLTSVRESVFAGEARMVVVDNNSSDDTIAIVKAEAPEATIVQVGRNAGYAAGANAGIAAAADCDGFLLLNPDLRLDADSIQRLVDEQAASGAGIVVPRLVDAAGRLRWSLRREPTVLRAWGEALLGGARAGKFAALGEVERREPAYSIRTDVAWATGAAMLITRECARSVGAWDESYFLYSEETDFALRARDAGFRIRYTPDARVVHFEGESHESSALYSLLTVNRVKLYRSRHGRAASRLFWCGIVAGELLRARRPVHRAALEALMGQSDGVARAEAPAASHPSAVGVPLGQPGAGGLAEPIHVSVAGQDAVGGPARPEHGPQHPADR